MGILFVLIIYAVVFGIAATFAAVVLSIVVARLVPRSNPGRKWAINAALLFPFACAIYAGAWFIAYATVNYEYFHRDPGLGDSWETPLPNGYELLMIDVTDEGAVYNPKTQPVGAGVVGREDAVFGVRQLQVSGNLIFGARDSGYFGKIGTDSNTVDRYFELNTQNGLRTEYLSLADLQQQAASEGVRLNLHPFATVYDKYRFAWFDIVSVLILLGVPMAGLILLARWIWIIRKETLPIPDGA